MDIFVVVFILPTTGIYLGVLCHKMCISSTIGDTANSFSKCTNLHCCVIQCTLYVKIQSPHILANSQNWQL